MAGGGAFESLLSKDTLKPINFKKIQTNTNTDISQCIFVQSVEKKHSNQDYLQELRSHLNVSNGSVPMDSQSKYAYVANSTYDVYIRYPNKTHKEKIWDHAAGYLIVRESGGTITDFHGNDLQFIGKELYLSRGIVVTSNESIHLKVLDAIKQLNK